MRGSSFGYLFKQGFKNVYANRVMSFAAIGVLVACMLLIGSSILLTLNMNGMLGYVEDQNEVVAFLRMDLTEQEKTAIHEELNSISNLNNISFVSGKEGILEWMDNLGDDAVYLEGLEEEEILPDSYRMMLDDLSIISTTVSEISAIDGVDKVIAPEDVAKTITSLKSAVYICGFFIVVLLALVSIVIIGNTIKITVFNRRKEINIMKMVGATDTFIRMPFFFEGFILGVISATLSFFLLWGGYEFVIRWIGENNITWFSNMQSNILDFKTIAKELYLGLFIGGTLIGTGGSMIFVRKYLKI